MQCDIRRIGIGWGGMAMFGLALLACAPISTSPTLAPIATPVWPQPPAEARIVYVQSITRPKDLGIKPGFFQRLGELLVGREDVHLIRPMAVVTDVHGTLYVADPGAKAVYRFDTAKSRMDLIRRKDGEAFPSPVGLARGPDNEIFVVDSFLASVFVIHPGASFAVPLALTGDLAQPSGMVCDPVSGALYVVDTGAHRVNVYAKDGTLRSTFGRRGGGDGEFNYPTMIWRDAVGRLYISDSLNFRVQIFDATGNFLGKFGEHGDATGNQSRPKGVATDRFNHIYVVDSMFHAVQVFDMSGRFLLSMGSQGHAAGEFWLPTGIFVDGGETIYVADSHNQRIQVFRYVGGQP